MQITHSESSIDKWSSRWRQRTYDKWIHYGNCFQAVYSYTRSRFICSPSFEKQVWKFCQHLAPSAFCVQQPDTRMEAETSKAIPNSYSIYILGQTSIQGPKFKPARAYQKAKSWTLTSASCHTWQWCPSHCYQWTGIECFGNKEALYIFTRYVSKYCN